MYKRKDKQKNIIYIGFLLILIVSIGYAILSATLSINGTANVSYETWGCEKVIFINDLVDLVKSPM